MTLCLPLTPAAGHSQLLPTRSVYPPRPTLPLIHGLQLRIPGQRPRPRLPMTPSAPLAPFGLGAFLHVPAPCSGKGNHVDTYSDGRAVRAERFGAGPSQPMNKGVGNNNCMGKGEGKGKVEVRLQRFAY